MKNRNLCMQAIVLFCLLPANLFSQQIIADHTVVDKYDQIPQLYINKVKEMWVTIPGESHSLGYRVGCQLLADLNAAYPVSVTESGNPEVYTNEHLRLSKATWGDVSSETGWQYGYGEEDWYTSPLAISRTKNHISYCNTNSLAIAAMGFGWCWDMTWTNSPTGTIDPLYQVRWAGSSDGGPQGNAAWGLDANDSVLTGNSVCMDNYLIATTEYSNYCAANSYPTKLFFTTGPVDGGGNTGENGYQRSIKHEYIRNYVQASSDRILFDYADILCWSDAGEQHTITWTDYGSVLRTFQYIHSDNMLDLDGSYAEDGDHIGQRGAVRLAKALWWMLARISGWDGIATDSKPTTAYGATSLVYPNPVKDILTIQPNQSFIKATISLSNLNGQELIRKHIQQNTTQIDLSNLLSGIYLAKITTDNTVEVVKIIKE
ncbi:MAG: T9SS type A sorting domain-containing protein [Paludibacteraceae bacterium]|nr:T9SS type A sorting domain-containing protein [Paludibacteraceae bacterium]MBN2787467.1 T9SS type A sorting domain-containing protein [Paludibacteraceae bacterium]